MSIRKREQVKSVLGRLNTRGGKVGAIAILFVLMATATAAVFSMDYATATATTSSADVILAVGSDNAADWGVGGIGPKTTQIPHATVTLSTTNDYATIGVNMFRSVEQTAPANQPATYYTDLLEVKNVGSVDHKIQQVVISNVNDPDHNLGRISVYYWASNPSTGNGAPSDVGSAIGCVNITANGLTSHLGASTQTNSGGTLTLAHTITKVVKDENGQVTTPGETDYIGIVAYASDGVTVLGSSVTFDLSIQWQ